MFPPNHRTAMTAAFMKKVMRGDIQIMTIMARRPARLRSALV